MGFSAALMPFTRYHLRMTSGGLFYIDQRDRLRRLGGNGRAQGFYAPRDVFCIYDEIFGGGTLIRELVIGIMSHKYIFPSFGVAVYTRKSLYHPIHLQI